MCSQSVRHSTQWCHKLDYFFALVLHSITPLLNSSNLWYSTESQIFFCFYFITIKNILSPLNHYMEAYILKKKKEIPNFLHCSTRGYVVVKKVKTQISIKIQFLDWIRFGATALRLIRQTCFIFMELHKHSFGMINLAPWQINPETPSLHSALFLLNFLTSEKKYLPFW